MGGLEDALHGDVDGLAKRANAGASSSGAPSIALLLKCLAASRAPSNAQESTIPEAEKETYESVAAERQEDIERATLQELSAMGISHLEDFDWSVRVALGSDKLSGQREPLLVLRLRVADVGGTSREVVVELPKDDLDNVLGTFAKIQQAVVKIKEY